MGRCGGFKEYRQRSTLNYKTCLAQMLQSTLTNYFCNTDNNRGIERRTLEPRLKLWVSSGQGSGLKDLIRVTPLSIVCSWASFLATLLFFFLIFFSVYKLRSILLTYFTGRLWKTSHIHKREWITICFTISRCETPGWDFTQFCIRHGCYWDLRPPVRVFVTWL